MFGFLLALCMPGSTACEEQYLEAPSYHQCQIQRLQYILKSEMEAEEGKEPTEVVISECLETDTE